MKTWTIITTNVKVSDKSFSETSSKSFNQINVNPINFTSEFIHFSWQYLIMYNCITVDDILYVVV